MNQNEQNIIPQERWFTQIADRILPPLFIIITTLIVLTAERKLLVGILCLVFLGINLIISEINKKSRLAHEELMNVIRIILALSIAFFIVLFSGKECPSWLISLPMIFGSGYAFRRLWLAFACNIVFITIITLASFYIGKPPFELATMVVCLSFFFVTNIFAVTSLNRKERDLVAMNTLLEIHEKQLNEANKTLQKTTDKLTIKSNEIIDFVNYVAHDLKNPLSGITTSLGLLKGYEQVHSNAEINELVHLGLRSAGYVTVLLDDLQQIARLEEGTIAMDFEPVEVGEVVGSILERLQGKIKDTGVIIKTDVDAVIECDKKGITKVFTNFVENAINYMNTDRDPMIFIGSTHEDDTWRFFVKDNGVGIPEDMHSAIFDKFNRGKQAPKTKGSGLGLAIAKAIVEAHNGRIWVESKIGEGSTFFISLPQKRHQQVA